MAAKKLGRTTNAKEKPPPQKNENGVVLLSAAILRLRRPTATPQCKPTSRPCWSGRASGSPPGRPDRAHGAQRVQGGALELPVLCMEGQGWFISYHVFTRLRKGNLP